MTDLPATGHELLLHVDDLKVQFDTDDGVVRAVDGVSFQIHRGDVFSIVGESGSGKSVSVMSLLGLLPSPPSRVAGGRALWKGEDLLTMSSDQLRRIRGKEIAMIFQDPMTALNPVHTIGRQIGEVARIHDGLSKSQARRRAIEVLDLVGIPQAASRVDNFPHEFSGGMRQRVMIAMAIVCEPDLLIADEPTTALDVTVQAQVLDVLLEIQQRIRSALLLITHDLGVVAGTADRVLVMYAGRPVEQGSTDETFYVPCHPYTRGLLGSLPRLDDKRGGQLHPIAGHPPSLLHPPSGCSFHPRCPIALVPGVCATDDPALRPAPEGDGSHVVACHRADEADVIAAVGRTA